MRILLVLACILFLPLTSFAGNRADHTFGIYLGIDNPFPTVVGGNVGFHLGDWARISGGYGTISSTLGASKLEANTYGGQFNLFVPSWTFTPTFGVGYSKVDVTLTGSSVVGLDVGGFTGSASHAFITVGLDWVSGIGFYFAAGWNHSLKSGVGGAPYVNIGWFF